MTTPDTPAGLDRHHFDHLLPGRPMLQVRHVMAALGMGETFVEGLVDSGQLGAHRFNAGAGHRMTIRISREEVVLYLLRTRSTEPRYYLAGVLTVLQALSLPGLLAVQERMPELIEKARARQPSSSGPNASTRANGARHTPDASKSPSVAVQGSCKGKNAESRTK